MGAQAGAAPRRKEYTTGLDQYIQEAFIHGLTEYGPGGGQEDESGVG